jgi:hypothetical protein
MSMAMALLFLFPDVIFTQFVAHGSHTHRFHSYSFVYRTKTSEALLQALNAKMAQVHENYQKEKLAKEQFETDLERIKKEAASSGSGKHRKGTSGPHMMDTDVLDQHMYQSAEYVGEYERMNYGAGKR